MKKTTKRQPATIEESLQKIAKLEKKIASLKKDAMMYYNWYCKSSTKVSGLTSEVEYWAKQATHHLKEELKYMKLYYALKEEENKKQIDAPLKTDEDNQEVFWQKGPCRGCLLEIRKGLTTI